MFFIKGLLGIFVAQEQNLVSPVIYYFCFDTLVKLLQTTGFEIEKMD